MTYIEYIAPPRGPYIGTAECVATDGIVNFDAWCSTSGKSYITGFGVMGTPAVLPSACYELGGPSDNVNGLSHCSIIFKTIIGNLYQLTCGMLYLF